MKRIISEGTISVLFGAHSIVHSILVIKSWKILYKKWPKFWELVCIFLHDIGHLGKNYLSNYEEKKKHWIFGAKIAKKLFGQKGYDLIAGHSNHSGVERNKLYKPDKYSWYITPYWVLWFNIFFERKLKRRDLTWNQSIKLWQNIVKENIESENYEENHVLYLRSINDKENSIH